MRRNQWTYLFGALFSISFTAAVLLFIIYGISTLSFAFTGAAFILLFIFVIIIATSPKDSLDIHRLQAPASSEEERRRAEEVYNERVKEAIEIALGKRDKLAPSEEVTAKPYEELKEKDVCMICKLFLKKSDTILQCPACESLYHQDHLLSWIKTKKKCPVCGQVLLKEKTIEN